MSTGSRCQIDVQGDVSSKLPMPVSGVNHRETRTSPCKKSKIAISSNKLPIPDADDVAIVEKENDETASLKHNDMQKKQKRKNREIVQPLTSE